MTREEFKEKNFRIAMDLQCIAMLLPDKVLNDCREYLERLDKNCSEVLSELNKYIEETTEETTFESYLEEQMKDEEFRKAWENGEADE